MTRKSSLLFSLFSVLVVLLTPTTSADTLYSDGFEGGLSAWAKNGEDGSSKITLISNGCASGNRCLEISKEKRRGFTFVGQTFRAPTAGQLTVSAMIRAPSLTTGSAEYYTGKFQAVVYDHGKEIDWPHADIREPVQEWVPRTFSVNDLSAGEEVMVRIGLQNAKGVLQVDDVKLTFVPD